MQFQVDPPANPSLTLDIQPYGLKGYVVTVIRDADENSLEPLSVQAVTNRSDLVHILQSYGVANSAIEDAFTKPSRQPKPILIALTVSTALWAAIGALVYLIWRLV